MQSTIFFLQLVTFVAIGRLSSLLSGESASRPSPSIVNGNCWSKFIHVAISLLLEEFLSHKSIKLDGLHDQSRLLSGVASRWRCQRSKTSNFLVKAENISFSFRVMVPSNIIQPFFLPYFVLFCLWLMAISLEGDPLTGWNTKFTHIHRVQLIF